MSAISDIDISYSDIGTKYVGLNPLIPISEESRYRHQLPFRYRTKSISDIPISKIDKSFPIDPRKILSLLILFLWIWTYNLCLCHQASYHCATGIYKYWCRMSDIGQKFIPISEIMSDSKHFSPISDVPISGLVGYRWSRILDWVPTYDKKRRNVHPTKLPAKIFKFYSEVWVLLVIFTGLALLPKKAGRLYNQVVFTDFVL